MTNLSFLNEILPLWAVCEFPTACISAQRSDGAPPQAALLKTRNALPEHPRSVIVAAFPYLLPEEYYRYRNIARFAVVRDYHVVCGARLEQVCALLREAYPGEAFAHYCDHSPLPEAALAEHAGLGFRGRHNLLITEKYGSWVVLGEIVTTAALSASGFDKLKCLSQLRTAHSCEACPAPCVKACPTGALSEAGFDKLKCLSYCSQRKGELDPGIAGHLRAAHSAWGCDICQEACVQNKKATVEPLPEFLQGAVAELTPKTPLEGWAYAWRGREVLNRNIANLT